MPDEQKQKWWELYQEMYQLSVKWNITKPAQRGLWDALDDWRECPPIKTSPRDILSRALELCVESL